MKTNIFKIKEKLGKFLSNDRLEHSFRVASLAVALAKTYHENLYYAEVSGLLHDCAKEISIQDYPKYGISTKKIRHFEYYVENCEGIIHSFASKEFARLEFGIKNRYILKAIESHTVGNNNMSLLDKIIFVADLVEPERQIKGIDKIRDIAFKDIDTAVILSFKLNLEYLIQNNKRICLDAVYNLFLLMDAQR